MICCLSASSQVKQLYNQYGGTWKKFQITSALRLPMIPVSSKDFNLTAIDSGQIYYDPTDSTIKYHTGFQWLTAGGSGGGGGSVDSVTFSPSENVDTVKYWIAGTGYVAGVVDVKCGLISPGTVVHDSLLSFTVSPSIHRSCLDGIRYTTTLAHLTLSAAHATLDRFDIIALEGSSVIVVEGDPSATPILPQLTPGQTYLTFISIPATATTPAEVTTTTIYDENTEFTVTSSGVTTNANNTTNVYHFLKAVDVGAVGLLSEIYFTGADFKISDYSSLRFFIKLKSSFANSTRLLISWLRDGVVQSTSVTLANNTYGYLRTNTTTYQEIIIPMSDFSFLQDTVDALRIKFSGSNANGFYFDWATLTGGIAQTAPQANGFGTVQTSSGAATSTQPNDVLNIVGAGGITTSASGKTVTIAGGASTNIYNTNSFVTADRTLTGLNNTYSLHLDSLKDFRVGRNGIDRFYFNSTTSFMTSQNQNATVTVNPSNAFMNYQANAFRVFSDSMTATKLIAYETNINGSLTTNALTTKSYVDSVVAAGGSTPGIDDVLAVGQSLSANRSISGAFDLSVFGVNSFSAQTRNYTAGSGNKYQTGLYADGTSSVLFSSTYTSGFANINDARIEITNNNDNYASASIGITNSLSSKVTEIFADTSKIRFTANGLNVTMPTTASGSQVLPISVNGNYADASGNIITTQSKGLTIEFPSSAESIGMWKTPVAITVSSLEAVLVGSSSPSVTFNIAFGTDRTSGTNVFSSGRTATSTTTGHTFNSSFNDATIPAGSFIWVTTSAQSGTVTQIEITINYTED